MTGHYEVITTCHYGHHAASNMVTNLKTQGKEKSKMKYVVVFPLSYLSQVYWWLGMSSPFGGRNYNFEEVHM